MQTSAVRYFILLVAILSVATLAAQLEAWQGVSFEHEVNPRYGYVLEVEYRSTFKDYGRGEYLFLGGLNRKLGREFNLTVASRFQNGGPEDPAEIRLLADLNFSRKLGETPLTLKARFRSQRDWPLNANTEFPTTDIRPRAGLDCRLNDRLTAFLEYEGRYQLDQRRREWTRVRYTGGLEFELTDQLNLELFYREEDRINNGEGSNRTDKIVGLFLGYTLPDDRERDWKYRQPFGRDLFN